MRLTSFLIFILFVGCKQTSRIPENFDYGKIEANVYRNSYFLFELPVPENWVVQSREQEAQIIKDGQKEIQKKNKILAAQAKAAEVNTATLLTLLRYKTDSSVTGENYNLMLLAENLSALSRIHTGVDYLKKLRYTLKRADANFQFPTDISTVRIGATLFDKMESLRFVNSQEIWQRYYISMQKGFALVFVLSFQNSEQGEELDNIIKQIKFVKKEPVKTN